MKARTPTRKMCDAYPTVWRYEGVRHRVALFLVALLVSCNKQPRVASHQTGHLMPLVEGTWAGTLEVQNVEYPFAVTFDHTGGNLRGEMDIIASLSPDIELTNVRTDSGLISFSLPLSGRESLLFEGRVSETHLSGTAAFSGDPEFRGTFTLSAVPFDSLPAWARGGDAWNWPDNNRQHWPTEDWRTISATTAGLDSQALSAASDQVRERFPGVRALLISRGGLLAYEEYFHGGSATERINIKSVSKGIITALVGIAIDEGNIASLDQAIVSLVPQYLEEAADKRKREIRLHHLLDMTSGLHWIENGSPTAEWARQGHSSGYYLSLPLDCTPGDCFNYSTASTHLLSEILALKTGMTTRAFAEKHVFDPIGLEIIDWRVSENGVHIGGAEIFMTPRDMLRIGLLVLSQGKWDEIQVIPVEWVHECVAYQSEGQPFVGSYGYGWWRRSIDGYPAFIGKGYGGQFIVVLPDADLVVVVGSDVSTPAMAPAIEHWICEYLIPTALSRK
jgi:CubicO group peptidase (beta-lactamase class C family)